MAMYGYVGLCMGVYAYLGLCRAMYGYVGLCRAMYDLEALKILINSILYMICIMFLSK